MRPHRLSRLLPENPQVGELDEGLRRGGLALDARQRLALHLEQDEPSLLSAEQFGPVQVGRLLAVHVRVRQHDRLIAEHAPAQALRGDGLLVIVFPGVGPEGG